MQEKTIKFVKVVPKNSIKSCIKNVAQKPLRVPSKLKNNQFEELLSDKEKASWESFKNVSNIFS